MAARVRCEWSKARAATRVALQEGGGVSYLQRAAAALCLSVCRLCAREGTTGPGS